LASYDAGEGDCKKSYPHLLGNDAAESCLLFMI